MTRRPSPPLARAAVCFVLALAGCPTPIIDRPGDDDDDDDAGEGEGEGDAGEGEGEGDAGEGEGKGDAGEGEGEAGEGEGEGEGEGDGPNPDDEAGDVDDPEPTGGGSFTVTVQITDGGDRDCFLFSIGANEIFDARAFSAQCPSFNEDPQIEIYDAADPFFPIIEDDDGAGVGFCSAIAPVTLPPGDYIACVLATDGGQISNLTLTVTLTTPELLGAGEACIPFETTRICDADQGLQCLLAAQPDVFQCATQQILGDGEVCTPFIETGVCDRDLELDCVDDDGDGSGICTNPAQAACALAQDYSEPNVEIEFPSDVFQSLIESPCSFGQPETIISYTTAETANLEIRAFGGGAVSVRSECAIASTELTCGFQQVFVPAVAGGTTLFIIAEADPGANIIVDVIARTISVLGPGEACVVGDQNNVCDPAQLLFCDGDSCEADDFGDRTNAAPVSLPLDVTMDVHPGDVDCVAFDVTDTATFAFDAFDEPGQCQGIGGFGFDTILELFNEQGASIAFNDDSNGFLCSHIDITLDPGVYTLCLREFGGDGTLVDARVTSTQQ